MKLLWTMLITTSLFSSAIANEGQVPKGVPALDRVFVIIMENYSFAKMIDNPNAPFIKKYANSANLATNYFAIGHPSLTNYLEIVGGSNFAVLSNDPPDWHNTQCSATKGSVCPLTGSNHTETAPAVDNPEQLPFKVADNISGKSIGDQLVAAKKSWKSYQESLPLAGADGVDYSDGFFSNLTDFSLLAPMKAKKIQKLYAVKHSPFVYFQNTQQGKNSQNSLKNVVGFEGPEGLYADLSTGKSPTLSFIVPNQCNDQHGLSDGGPSCEASALVRRGDLTLERIVNAIHESPVWKKGRNAIIVTWDEGDSATKNQVITIVDTNYGHKGVRSGQLYSHFSLLKSLEAGLGLPCLNHACDDIVNVMGDLFK